MLYDLDQAGQGDAAFGTTVSLSEDRPARRYRPLHYGANLTGWLEFTLTFGAQEYGLDRFDLEAVAAWLTGHQDYRWLTIDQDDLEPVRYRCIIRELRPVTVAGLPVAFTATVQCDGPYAYAYPREESFLLAGRTDLLLRCDSAHNGYYFPRLKLELDGVSNQFSMVNHADGDREFLLSGLPAGVPLTLEADCENCILQETGQGHNPYEWFNFKFFRMVRGDNPVTVTGDGRLTLQYEFPRNVGA